MTERLKALNDAKADHTSLDYWHNNSFAKCPHCGHDNDVQECELYELYEEGNHDVRCEKCELDFVVNTEIEYKLSTEDQDEDDA